MTKLVPDGAQRLGDRVDAVDPSSRIESAQVNTTHQPTPAKPYRAWPAKNQATVPAGPSLRTRPGGAGESPVSSRSYRWLLGSRQHVDGRPNCVGQSLKAGSGIRLQALAPRRTLDVDSWSTGATPSRRIIGRIQPESLRSEPDGQGRVVLDGQRYGTRPLHETRHRQAPRTAHNVRYVNCRMRRKSIPPCLVPSSPFARGAADTATGSGQPMTCRFCFPSFVDEVHGAFNRRCRLVNRQESNTCHVSTYQRSRAPSPKG